MPAVTDAEKARIRELARNGLGCNAIARELGRPASTVSVAARKLGIKFDRSETKQAVAARVVDLRERRAAGAAKQAEIAERLQEQVFAAFVMRSIGGRENTYTEREIDEPPPQDKLMLVRASQMAWTTSMKLTEFASGEPGEGAKSLLSGLAAALNVAAETLPDAG